MNITLELSPEAEASFAALAAARGVALTEYLQMFLDQQVIQRDNQTLSNAERAKAWIKSAENLPLVPPLSDEAISRENIYGAR